jgi:hypothetical protein
MVPGMKNVVPPLGSYLKAHRIGIALSEVDGRTAEDNYLSWERWLLVDPDRIRFPLSPTSRCRKLWPDRSCEAIAALGLCLGGEHTECGGRRGGVHEQLILYTVTLLVQIIPYQSRDESGLLITLLLTVGAETRIFSIRQQNGNFSHLNILPCCNDRL